MIDFIFDYNLCASTGKSNFISRTLSSFWIVQNDLHFLRQTYSVKRSEPNANLISLGRINDATLQLHTGMHIHMYKQTSTRIHKQTKSYVCECVCSLCMHVSACNTQLTIPIHNYSSEYHWPDWVVHPLWVWVSLAYHRHWHRQRCAQHRSVAVQTAVEVQHRVPHADQREWPNGQRPLCVLLHLRRTPDVRQKTSVGIVPFRRQNI